MNKKTGIKWFDKITNMFFDNNGKPLKGVTNGVTIQKLLRKVGQVYDNESAEGRELINIARQELNHYMKKLNQKHKLPAGSIGFKPTIFLIAENKFELRMMFYKRAKAIGGRIENMVELCHPVIKELPAYQKAQIVNNENIKMIEEKLG